MDNYVKCPICGKQLKIITKTHYGVHGYNSKEEFLKDFPNAKLMSDVYAQKYKEIHGAFLAQYNKTDIQRKKSSDNAKKRNSNSEFQRKMQSKRKYTSQERKKVSKSLTKAWKDGKRTYTPNYGKKHEYVLRDKTKIYLRSFLECKYVRLFELNRLKFSYESLKIPYTYKGKQHNYLPDFYLPKYNLIIEVKPEEKQKDSLVQIKMKASINQGYQYLFAGYNELKDYKAFLNTIKALSAK